jgi:hypothetical protein
LSYSCKAEQRNGLHRDTEFDFRLTLCENLSGIAVVLKERLANTSSYEEAGSRITAVVCGSWRKVGEERVSAEDRPISDNLA